MFNFILTASRGEFLTKTLPHTSGNGSASCLARHFAQLFPHVCGGLKEVENFRTLDCNTTSNNVEVIVRTANVMIINFHAIVLRMTSLNCFKASCYACCGIICPHSTNQFFISCVVVIVSVVDAKVSHFTIQSKFSLRALRKRPALVTTTNVKSRFKCHFTL